MPAHEISAVFAVLRAAIVLPASRELRNCPSRFRALLKKADGRELPIELSYIFAHGPNVDRSKISRSVSGVDLSEIAVGDKVWVDNGAC